MAERIASEHLQTSGRFPSCQRVLGDVGCRLDDIVGTNLKLFHLDLQSLIWVVERIPSL